MKWTSDVTAGDWLRERIDHPWTATIHDVVPRGFPAYARVLHPTTRSRPVDRPWPPFPQDHHRREWEAFAAARPEIETTVATWQDAADAFGTTRHPLAQWAALVRTTGGEPGETQRAVSAEGWEFDPPRTGDLDADVLARVVSHLVGDAPTPGYAAVWSGWGGLLGHLGTGPSRAVVSVGESDDPEQRRLHDTLSHSLADPFNRPYATESWQPGILPDDVSRGTLLDLPGREHVLFATELGVFADASWPSSVPWTDPELAAAGFAHAATSPSILWPADRSWVLVTEVDWDSTIVGGPAALIARLVADDGVEALPLPADASLLWDADEVNR